MSVESGVDPFDAGRDDVDDSFHDHRNSAPHRTLAALQQTPPRAPFLA